MEKLQQIMNITNADGEVITFFDGKVTLSQLLVGIAVLAVVLFAIKVIKGVFKTIIIIASICIGLVHYNIASPTQIKDVASQIASNGVTAYQTFANASENIKIDGSDIQVKVGDNWFSISDVTSIVQGTDGVATVTVDGETYTTEDNNIIELLNSFK